MNKNNKQKQTNYQDYYFCRGHIFLKVWQTLVTLLFWFLYFIPIVVTIMTYLAYRTHGRYGHFFWHYLEGFTELNFLMVFLTFAFAVTAVFCISSSYIQYKRHHALIEKWPMFDIRANRKKHKRAEVFMTNRFGSAEERESQRYYVVRKEQNLTNNQLKKVINGDSEGNENGN